MDDAGDRPSPVRAPPRRAAHVLDRRWWDDRIMAWAMQDESVKVQMFRFIDVLPMLTDRDAVTRHLHEYFHDVRQYLPSAARLGLSVATPGSIAGRGLGHGRAPQRHGTRPAVHRRHQPERSAGRRQARAQAPPGLHARRAGRSGHQRTGGRRLPAGLRRADRRHRPHGQLLARGAASRPRSRRRAAPRQRLGQALGARQPVRSDRPRGFVPPGRRPAADTAASARRGPAGVRQRRHGVVPHEGPHARRLPTDSAGRRIPRHGRRGHRHPVLLERLGRRPAQAARLGRAARQAGLGAAGQGSILGLRNRACRGHRLAGTGLPAQVADRRQLRVAHPLRTVAPRAPAPGAGQPQPAFAGPRHGRGPGVEAAGRRASSCKCSTAWPTPRSRPWSISAIACASTCPTAS